MHQRALTILGLGALCALALAVVVGLLTGSVSTASAVGAVCMGICGAVIAADAGRRERPQRP